MSLIGKYFLNDTHEYYRTGVVLEAIVQQSSWLVAFDIADSDMPARGKELVSVDEMLSVCKDCGSKHWRFFDTPAERQEWIDWVNTPDEKPQVVKLVQKKKK